MPFEKNRKRHSLKIPIPGETQYAFYIWVTDEITFVRQDGIRQEIRLSMLNAPGQTTRTVIKDDVEVGGNSPIKVETITKATHKETQGIRQEADWSFLTDPQTHLKTHDITIKARKKDGTESANFTLKLRKIDQFYVKETQGIGQEAYWTLDHRDDEAQIDFAHPDAVYNKDHGALRLDWFQNVVKSDPLYMLILHSGNKIAAIPMANIKNPVGKVKVNKTSVSNWRPYSYSENYSTQLKLATNSHVAILYGLKISSAGDISLTTPRWKYVAYNTKKSLLECAESTIQGAAYFHPIFNGNGSDIYDDSGCKYTISQTGSISFASQVFEIRNYSTAYPTASSGWYGPTTDQLFAINSGWVSSEGGLYTAEQYAQLTSNPGFYNRITWGGPGVSDAFVLWADNFGTVDHFPVYSNNGTLDTVDIQTAPVSGTFSRTDVGEPGQFLIHQVSSSSYGSLSFSLDWTYGETPAPEFLPVDERTVSGQSDYSVVPTFHLDNNPLGGMFIDWLENPGNDPGSNNPFDGTYSPDSSRSQYVFNFAANGKHFLYRYVINDENYKINIDRTDYTAAYTQALGVADLSSIDFILFDIKKSDIDKLK